MPPFVLLVGDDDGIRRMWSDALARRGYRVDTAPDGRQALDHLAFGVPDVIVGDAAMGFVDGQSLVRSLRRRGLDVPVVLTGPAPTGGRLPGVQFVPDPRDLGRVTGAVHLGLASRLA